MTATTGLSAREFFREVFAEKNERRRRCKANDPRSYRLGRERRRLLAPTGAFGNVPPARWNELIVGTTGLPQ